MKTNTTTALKDYFLLIVQEDNKKEFHFRVEDSTGGRHSLTAYLASAVTRVDRRKNGISHMTTPDWIMKRFNWLYDNRKGNLVQNVVCKIQATDSKSAQSFLRKTRQELIKALEKIGYKNIG